jgi:hypothetical protein
MVPKGALRQPLEERQGNITGLGGLPETRAGAAMNATPQPKYIDPLAKKDSAKLPNARGRPSLLNGSRDDRLGGRRAGGLADAYPIRAGASIATFCSPLSCSANIVAGLKDHRRGIRIEGHANWIAPGLDGMNLILQHATDHDDPAVALCEMLL